MSDPKFGDVYRWQRGDGNTIAIFVSRSHHSNFWSGICVAGHRRVGTLVEDWVGEGITDSSTDGWIHILAPVPVDED